MCALLWIKERTTKKLYYSTTKIGPKYTKMRQKIRVILLTSYAYTVAASSSDIFVQNGKFWHILTKFEKMCLNMAKIFSMPHIRFIFITNHLSLI